MNKIIAVKTKNQSLVNKAIKWLEKYHVTNDARDFIDSTYGDDNKQWEKMNAKCELQWDNYTEYLEELPKYEIKNIESSELYLTN